MSSKAFAFLGLLFAIVVLIASEVATRDVDLAPTSTKNNNEVVVAAMTNGVGDDKYGWGVYGGDYPGRGGNSDGDYYSELRRRGRGPCRYGACCSYPRSRCECCKVGEIADAKP